MTRMSEIVNLPVDELKIQHDQLCREIYMLRNELRVSRKLDKPHELTEKKKQRARILTALNMKKTKN